jgi:membrane protein
MLAGSLSYFIMMAFIPLCIFLFTILGYILGHYQGVYEFLLFRMVNFFPDVASGITKEIAKLIQFKGIGTVSLLLYAILSYQVFASIENALNIIFEIKKKRMLIWSILISMLIITLIILILCISFIATSLIPLIKTLKKTFPNIHVGIITFFLIRYAIPFLIIFLLVFISYTFFPKIKVKISYALIGSLFTSILLEIAKNIFTWYVGSVIKFGSIYGPLTAFIIFLLWLFYSSCIFLIGAELVHNLITYKKK